MISLRQGMMLKVSAFGHGICQNMMTVGFR